MNGTDEIMITVPLSTFEAKGMDKTDLEPWPGKARAQSRHMREAERRRHRLTNLVPAKNRQRRRMESRGR